MVHKEKATQSGENIDRKDMFSLVGTRPSSIKLYPLSITEPKKSGLWQEIMIPVNIIEKIMPKIWSVYPIRWIVERSFEWTSHSLRLSKDYEISIESAENMLIVSHLTTPLCK